MHQRQGKCCEGGVFYYRSSTHTMKHMMLKKNKNKKQNRKDLSSKCPDDITESKPICFFNGKQRIKNSLSSRNIEF